MQLPDLSLLVMMALFWATYFVLRATVFRPLGAILEEREHRAEHAAAALRSAMERHEQGLLEIDRRLTETRREVMQAREVARTAAQGKRQEIVDAARESAQRSAAEIQARLARDAETARAELKGQVEVLAREIASAALGRKVA